MTFSQGFQYDIMERHGEGFETSPAPNHFDHARIIMASRQIRPIRVEGNVAYVPLTKGYEAIIDAQDAPLVEMWNWRAMVRPHTVYAVRTHRSGSLRREIFMHRVVMGGLDGPEVDHRDCNGLNCRRGNLRFASRGQQECNKRVRRSSTSGLKGVTWDGSNRKWRARIYAGGVCAALGYFPTKEAAHAAYAKASAELHGEFGRAG